MICRRILPAASSMHIYPFCRPPCHAITVYQAATNVSGTISDQHCCEYNVSSCARHLLIDDFVGVDIPHIIRHPRICNGSRQSWAWAVFPKPTGTIFNSADRALYSPNVDSWLYMGECNLSYLFLSCCGFTRFAQYLKIWRLYIVWDRKPRICIIPFICWLVAAGEYLYFVTPVLHHS